jgi:hypothetical protein
MLHFLLSKSYENYDCGNVMRNMLDIPNWTNQMLYIQVT